MRRTLVTGLVSGLCLMVTVQLLAQPGAAAGAGGEPPMPGRQAPQSFETKVALNYLLYLPENYGKEQGEKFPHKRQGRAPWRSPLPVPLSAAAREGPGRILWIKSSPSATRTARASRGRSPR
jgi:hypothetical protein